MVLKEAPGAPGVVREATDCRHHWVIEPANGRYSQGECRKCHEVRAFENSIYEGPDKDAE